MFGAVRTLKRRSHVSPETNAFVRIRFLKWKIYIIPLIVAFSIHTLWIII